MIARSLLFLIFATATVYGQEPFFQHYQLHGKKANVQTNDILQAPDGFIWFATTKGLFRFDGKENIAFAIPDTIGSKNVTALALDSLGRIWTGHGNGRIAFLEHGIAHAFDPPEGTSSNEISDLTFDRHGNLWFSTLNDGLYYYTRDRLYRLDEQEGLPDLFIYDIQEDAEGNILAATDGGVAICRLKDSKVSIQVLDNRVGLPDNIVRKIATKGNDYWFGTEDVGVVHYNQDAKRFSPLVNGWAGGPVTDLALKNNELWVASPQSGLTVFDLGTGLRRIYHGSDNTLASSRVLMLDEEENIWIGSKNGLHRTSGTNLEFFIPDGPKDKNILAVTVDRQGQLWFSTGDGLFTAKAKADGKWDTVKKFQGSLPANSTVISLYSDADGSVWAGLYGEGLLRIDSKSNRVRHFSKELRNGNVLHVTGRGNDIWLATLGGASKISLGTDPSVENFSREEGLSSDFIYQVFVDSKERVWFATDGKGVDMLDDKGFHNFQKGLVSKVVYRVEEDSKGRILVNVQGSGLFTFNGTDGFDAVADPVKTRSNELYSFTTDAGGNVVAFHDSGIDVFTPDLKKVRYLGEESGLRDKIANLNAIGRDPQGNLYIGTADGIVKYTNGNQFLGHDPQPAIRAVKIFDQPGSHAELRELPFNQNNLTFDVVGLWFQNPENLVFSYKLENYDRDWLHTRNNSITYSRLPPGKYTFKVRVSESDNINSASESSVDIEIFPPFWRTNLFYALVVISIAAGVYGLLKYRERKLRYNNMILEARVRARTLEVQRQNDEIQAQNEEITAQAEEIKGINENLEQLVIERTFELERKNKALEEYAFINAHKLRSPVASILGLAHLMSKTDLDNEGKEINKRLQNSVDELDDIVRSITKAIERGDHQPYKTKN